MKAIKNLKLSTRKWVLVGTGIAGLVTLSAFLVPKLMGGSVASFLPGNQQKLFMIQSDKKIGYVDQNGKVVIQPQFEPGEGFHDFSDGLAAVQINKKWGYIDTTGKVVIQPQFDLAGKFAEGLAVVATKDKVSYIDKTGKVIFPVPAEQSMEVSNFSESLAPVKLGKRWGYIDSSGKFAINPQFDAVGVFSDGFAVIVLNGKVGYVDKSGKIAITPQYEDASKFSDGLAPIKSSGKWGFVDKSGKNVIPAQFDEVQIAPESYGWVGFSDGLTAVKVGNTWGYVDRSGKLVINPQFDVARSFSEGLAAVKLGDRWGFIDKSGKIIINPQFTGAQDFVNGLAMVSDQQSGYIDHNGKFVWTVNDPSYISPQDKSAQSDAKATLGLINRSQQAYYVSRNQFSPLPNDLGITLNNSNDYAFDITVIGQNRVKAVATPKRNGLKSYADSVAVVGSGTISVLCESNQASQQTLDAPQLNNSDFKCSSGSSKVQ